MANCPAEIVPIYQEDPCGGERKNVKCIIDENVYIDLGIEADSNQGDINQAVYNALQTGKAVTDNLQQQLDEIAIPTYLVTDLPITATLGDQAIVTDAVAPTYLGALTGGGAVNCPVWYNGTSWVSR